MHRSVIGLAWVMALVGSIVMLAIAAAAIVLAVVAPANSTAQLDAWRGAIVSIALLVVVSSMLAALTVARLRRGESILDDAMDDAAPVVIAIDADGNARPL